GMVWLVPAGLLCLPARGILSLFQLLFANVQQLPGALLVTGCPTIFQMLLVYCAEGMFLYCWYHRLWRKFFNGTIFTAALFFCFHPENALRIVMLDVGQGDGIYIRTAGGESMLIDGGSSSRTGVGQYVIEPALKYYGESRLDYIIVTHGDTDHISGIQELFEMGYPVVHLLLQTGQEDDEALQLLAALAAQAGTEVSYVGRGDQIVFPEMTMTCLHPFSDFFTDDRNAASLVFHLSYDTFDALFTGDLEETGEEALCQRLSENTLFSGELELLKVAHHGSRYSTSEEFLSLTEPEMALVSAGRGNMYGHPHAELLDRLADYDVAVFQTQEMGAIVLETNGSRWKVLNKSWVYSVQNM
ncbi:MAG: MBL fold metallo-hydrolase, partial [Clostridiales bacterium]|nr:MBL fold metallo-hydrolase [Clostridiales bacterium]